MEQPLRGLLRSLGRIGGRVHHSYPANDAAEGDYFLPASLPCPLPTPPTTPITLASPSLV